MAATKPSIIDRFRMGAPNNDQPEEEFTMSASALIQAVKDASKVKGIKALCVILKAA